MAVKDFMPITDVKQTVEKEVKRRPSIEELTSVEKPGKPVSAEYLVRNKKTRSSPSKLTKIKAEKIPKEKRDSILIITEKPQAAQKIAQSLGTARKYTENNVSYYEIQRGKDKIIVASAVGHLFTLTYSKGQKGWPIFDLEWIPSFLKKESAFTKRYYDLLKKLSYRAKDIIIATDFDVEGEVIGWNVLRFICREKNAKRMKFSTLTKDELEKSFESPLLELNWQNAYAGEARHFVDWMYGINLSRALMSAIKRTGSFKILSIGRVQGPALKIIVDREREIESFVSQPYWQISLMSNGIQFRHPKDIFDKKEIDKFKDITEADAKVKNSEETIQPPHPFDLTTLQREAYRLYKMSPSEVLRIAQKLYLDGLISYPRTSSQKIPKEIEPHKILKKLERHFKETENITRKIPIEGKKSDPAHPSIYPTGEFAELPENERKLYELVVKRFISAFSKDAITLNKKITLTAKDLDFTASGLKIKEKGWLNVYPIKYEESDLPDINGKVKVDEVKIEEKETEPPRRYSPTSLLTLLEKKNLGTKATRSSIIDTLFERGYLDGTSIKATPLGLRLIESLEKHSPIIIDENLTRTLEEEMESIQNATSDFQKKEDAVIKQAKDAIEKISIEFKSKEEEIGKSILEGIIDVRKEQQEASILMPCPTCKKGNLRIMFNRKSRRYFVACSAYPECTQTYTLPPNSLIKKADKTCEADNFPKLLAIRKGKRPWEFCFNPSCPIEKEKREKWEARKQGKE